MVCWPTQGCFPCSAFSALAEKNNAHWRMQRATQTCVKRSLAGLAAELMNQGPLCNFEPETSEKKPIINIGRIPQMLAPPAHYISQQIGYDCGNSFRSDSPNVPCVLGTLQNQHLLCAAPRVYQRGDLAGGNSLLSCQGYVQPRHVPEGLNISQVFRALRSL